jgi:hypothetical protein
VKFTATMLGDLQFPVDGYHVIELSDRLPVKMF